VAIRVIIRGHPRSTKSAVIRVIIRGHPRLQEYKKDGYKLIKVLNAYIASIKRQKDKAQIT